MAPGTISSEILEQPWLRTIQLDASGRLDTSQMPGIDGQVISVDLSAIHMDDQAQRNVFENLLLWGATRVPDGRTTALRGDGVWQQLNPGYQRVNPYIYDNDRAGEGFYYGRTGAEGIPTINPYTLGKTWAEIQAYIEEVENITLEF